MIKLLLISYLNILGKLWKENNFSLFIKSDKLFCLTCLFPHGLALHCDICQDFLLCSRLLCIPHHIKRQLVLLQLLKTPPSQVESYLLQSLVLESITIITPNPICEMSLVEVLEEHTHTTVWHFLSHLHPDVCCLQVLFQRWMDGESSLVWQEDKDEP